MQSEPKHLKEKKGGANVSQPIIHVLVDFYYGGQQQWNNLHRTPVARTLVIMNGFNTDTKQRHNTHTHKKGRGKREMETDM